MLLLDVTIVNVALPSIERALRANFSDLQCVIHAYALTLARLAARRAVARRQVRRRLFFMLPLAVFTASSLACALAPDPLFLHISRAAQRIRDAMMFRTSLALIAQEFQSRAPHRAPHLALPLPRVATAPLVRRALVHSLSSRSIFLVNVPIGLAALVSHRCVARVALPAASASTSARALLCPALFLLVYALIRGNEEAGERPHLSCFTASALLLVLFVVAERPSPDPPLALSLFRKPAFTGATSSPSRCRRRSSRCSSTSRSFSRTFSASRHSKRGSGRCRSPGRSCSSRR